MEDYGRTGWDVATGIKKTIVFILPFGFLQGVFSRFPHLGFALGIILGTVSQHFFPPRGRRLWPVLSIAAIGAIVRLFFP
jgi:hypothetical protein